ncbi:MAG: TrmH family RNA methyltransferase [Bryobacteraceae bacterium]
MPRTELITSAANPLLKQIRRAASQGTLTADGLLLLDSAHLVAEAIRSGCVLRTVLLAARRAEEAPHYSSLCRVLVVDDRLFDCLASTETTQGLMALIDPPEWPIERIFRRDGLVIVLDAIQDPGNCGAIFRSAEAFGACGILATPGTAGVFNPKTLRASAGSALRVPNVMGIGPETLAAQLAERGIRRFAALPAGEGTCSPENVDWRGSCAMLIGSEGRGLDPRLTGGAVPVSIPTESVESLNAAIAASILLYEARRQRTGLESPCTLKGAPREGRSREQR